MCTEPRRGRVHRGRRRRLGRGGHRAALRGVEISGGRGRVGRGRVLSIALGRRGIIAVELSATTFPASVDIKAGPLVDGPHGGPSIHWRIGVLEVPQLLASRRRYGRLDWHVWYAHGGVHAAKVCFLSLRGAGDKIGEHSQIQEVTISTVSNTTLAKRNPKASPTQQKTL